MEDAPPNYEQICKNLKKEQENDRQVIHDFKKKIQVYEILEKEYQEEIERLKNDNVKITKKLEVKIEQFEREKVQFRSKDEMQYLQTNLEKIQAENFQLKSEIETCRKIQEISVCDNDKPNEDLENLKENIVQLEKMIEDLNLQLAVSQKKCSELEEHKENLKSENANLLETLELKRDELKKNNELIQDLQDNALCLKAELDSLRNKPLDEKTRGNSLFAEVNDSRIELLNKMKLMATKYNHMFKNRQNLLSEIDSLRNEKVKLIEIFQKDMQEYQPGNQTEILYYKSAIDGYQKLNESYKQEIAKLKKADSSTPQKDFRYFEKRLETKEKELETLREDFRLHLSNYTNYSWQINRSEKEMVKWKWTATDLENQVRILEQKVEKLKDESTLQTLNSNEIKENSTECKVENLEVEEYSKDTENIDNVKIRKAVHFAENSNSFGSNH